MVKNNCFHLFVQSEEIFPTIPNEHNSVKDTREKVKKLCNIDLKVSMKILLHSPLLSFHLILRP